MLKETLVSKIKDYLNTFRIKLNINLGEAFDVVFLAQGEYNINFAVQDDFNKWVFRVNTGSQLQIDNQIVYEYEALKRLEISGVTPKAYYVDDTRKNFDYGILIMEFLEGVPLNYKGDLNKAASIFSKIHGLNLDNVDISNFVVENSIFTDRILESERLLKDYLNSPKVEVEKKIFLDSFLNWAKLNQYKQKYFDENKWHVINNTEVNSNNFIIGSRGNYLIDWEKPVISDPCQDITQFLAPTTTLWKTDYVLSEEEKKEFFKVYIDGLGTAEKGIRERVELYNPYLYLRALSWCAFAYIEYLKPEKDIKNMDTFGKVKQYLELDFMKALLKDYVSL